MSQATPERTIVVGLDGAGFDLLDPWLSDGELPTLERILDGGVRGRLESVLPPVTSPNWKALSTGMNPGKIGIFWWQNVDTENRRVYLPRERYHVNEEYWEIIARDEPVGVIGMPTTYPPKSVGEFVVSGPPDAANEGFTYPPSLERELRERFDYGHSKQHRLREGSDAAYEEVLDLIDREFTVAKYLLDEYDLTFLQVVTFYINALHHSIWDHEYTLQGWRIIDDHLAEFLDGETNLVLVSDHGHKRIQTVFRINRWLEQEGYLSYDRTVSDTFYRLGINADRLQRTLNWIDRTIPGVGFRDIVDRLVPRALVEHIPDEHGQLGASKHSQANWDETEVLASAQGPVYVTPNPASPRYEELREELTDRLTGLTDPTGRPVIHEVYRGEEVYSGRYVDEGPDLVVEQAPGAYIAEHVGDRTVFDDEDDAWEGVNARYGLFAATGPSFTTGTIDDMSILDIAPTLLQLHGKEVPSGMDGRVRGSVFAADSPATHGSHSDTGGSEPS